MSDKETEFKGTDLFAHTLIKKYGFLWFKSNCTDKVDVAFIADILPAANGFTVVYKDCKLKYSTAKVEKIMVPEDKDGQWIRVHWSHIEDEAA